MNFGFFRELSVIERSPSVYTTEDTLPTFLWNIRRRCKQKRQQGF